MERSYGVIYGCPRSGTTFLVDALAGADDTLTTSYGYPSQAGVLWNAGIDDDARYILQVALAEFPVVLARSVEQSRLRALTDAAQRTIGPRELLDGLLHRRQLRSVIYKEPFLAFSPELPYRAVPEARIVHIHRDGRDAADSLVRTFDPLSDASLRDPDGRERLMGRPQADGRLVPWWVEADRDDEFLAATPYVRCVWLWKEMVRRAHDFATRPDVVQDGRVMEVRYDQLVTEPVHECRRVAGHLGVPVGRRLQSRFARASARSVGIHRRLPAHEIAAASELAADELKLLGYDAG